MFLAFKILTYIHHVEGEVVIMRHGSVRAVDRDSILARLFYKEFFFFLFLFLRFSTVYYVPVVLGGHIYVDRLTIIG